MTIINRGRNTFCMNIIHDNIVIICDRISDFFTIILYRISYIIESSPKPQNKR